MKRRWRIVAMTASTFCGPGTVQGLQNRVMNKTEFPPPMSFQSNEGDGEKLTHALNTGVIFLSD